MKVSTDSSKMDRHWISLPPAMRHQAEDYQVPNPTSQITEITTPGVNSSIPDVDASLPGVTQLRVDVDARIPQTPSIRQDHLIPVENEINTTHHYPQTSHVLSMSIPMSGVRCPILSHTYVENEEQKASKANPSPSSVLPFRELHQLLRL